MKRSRRQDTVRAWVTTPDRRLLLAPLTVTVGGAGASSPDDVITVDETKVFQPMLGFGAALTDSSAFLLNGMPEKDREALLRDLFDPKQGIGFSVLRVPMGASDFSSRGNYTYNDLPAGETDPEQKRFSIEPDKAYILPLLRRIRRINPALKVIASPWSAPAWMKTGRKLNGGWLDWPAYPAFARYFVRFVKAYAAEGVPVEYITVQNEPRNERDSYPTMRMEPHDQARFVKDHLGPAFAEAGIKTKILVWDHNWDAPDYPLAVLSDAAARRYIAGVAWHAYGGEPTAQAKIRDAYPAMEQHFTESSGGDWAKDFGGNMRWDITNLMVGSVRYGARSVLKWNLVLDENHGPTNGGCTDCRGIVTLNRKTGQVTRNEEYYAFGHASRFVRPGAKVLGSTTVADLPNVAFRNPDGSRVLVLSNNRAAAGARDIQIRSRQTTMSMALPPGAIATLRWPRV
jgi:glucosylceramidase